MFFTVVILTVSSWLMFIWLTTPGNFPIKKIRLVNQLIHQENEELHRVAANAIDGGFFNLNVERFQNKLINQLPWIKSVSVRKVWPHTLLIAITEHKPVVRWQSLNSKNIPSASDGEITLLSQEGVIFRPEISEQQQSIVNRMAVFFGPSHNAKTILNACSTFNKQLQQLKTNIKKCGMNERRTWKILLENKIEIKLGKENINQKLERFINVFSKKLNKYFEAINYVDLRYANGFSVQWHFDSKQTTDEREMTNKKREA